MKKKSIIILVAIIIFAALLVLVGILYFKNRSSVAPVVSPSATFTPEILPAAEVAGLGLPSGTKVQALKRGSAGEVMVYKIIRRDKDIVDPAQVGSISPPATKR